MTVAAKKWETNGLDSAQLFRDFYFGKYDTKDYDAASIHKAQDRSLRFNWLESHTH